MEKNYAVLSKVISHALRHEPWLYELELDACGWVPIESLLASIKLSNENFETLTEKHLLEMIEQSDKKRHEIRDGKIRALYGHSTPQKLIKEASIPPEVLYHGTSPEILEKVKLHGLLPMQRQYVHLSVNVDMAFQVGKRKSKNPVVLEIDAKKASKGNVKFYQGNDLIWLADKIPVEFINFKK